MSPESASPFPQSRRHGSNSGQPLTRRDGALKVTGRATYAADNHPADMLYAVTVASRIARGRVTALDITAAKAHPGVVEVLTPANRPPLAHDPDEKMPPFGFRVEVLQDDSVRYVNQPIALVIAESALGLRIAELHQMARSQRQEHMKAQHRISELEAELAEVTAGDSASAATGLRARVTRLRFSR